MKKVLITGIGGFIGSHFLAHFLVNTDWSIIGIDSWRHKGIPERVSDSVHYKANKDRVEIYTHDLTTPISEILKEKIGKVDYIINMASQSHVDRSITHPVSFIQNNVNLILNMLEFAREVKPEKFVQIGTDESYGPAKQGYNHKEWDAILPSNPYSASKACQEAIAISYWRTYGVPVILTNTMNNFAEMQDEEKFIPMCIKNIIQGEEIQIHSDPTLKKSGSRFWIHCRNHADAILHILKDIKVTEYPECDRPERFNVVGEHELSNLDIAKLIAKILDRDLKYKMVDAHSSRPGHDLRYALDGRKLQEYGWNQPKNFMQSFTKTVQWYLKEDNRRWLGIVKQLTGV